MQVKFEKYLMTEERFFKSTSVQTKVAFECLVREKFIFTVYLYLSLSLSVLLISFVDCFNYIRFLFISKLDASRPMDKNAFFHPFSPKMRMPEMWQAHLMQRPTNAYTQIWVNNPKLPLQRTTCRPFFVCPLLTRVQLVISVCLCKCVFVRECKEWMNHPNHIKIGLWFSIF